MKRIATIWLCLLLLAVIPVSAELSRIVDNAGLLSSDAKQELTEEIAQIADDYQFDVVIVTEQSFGGKTATAYADDYFDYNGYGYGSSHDGILLAVSMGDRSWAISTTGYGLTAFSDYMTDYMGDQIAPLLTSGDYDQAFETYVTLTRAALKEAESGRPYDINHPYALDINWGRVRFAAVIALLIGLIVALCFRGQLRTARPKPYAGEYIRKGSFQLHYSRDIFLYSHTTRSEIPRDGGGGGGGSSSHSGSSGVSHGGSSGRF